MKYSIKTTTTKLFSLIFIFSLIIGIFTIPSLRGVSAEDGDLNNNNAVMLNAEEFSNYLTGTYKTAYGIKNSDIDLETLSTNGGENGNYRLSNIFDGNKSSFWISELGNTEQSKISVTVNFKSEKLIHNILYGVSYYSRSNGRNFSGYPSTLNVYAAKTGEDFKLVDTITSTPNQDTEFVLFSLNQAVSCNSIKLEFADVITFRDVFGGKDVAVISDLAFYTTPENIELSTPINAQGDYNSDNFLISNSVSNNMLSARANGGGDVRNAFDGNTRTYWSSTNYNTELFKNKVTVVFDKPVKLESIVYSCSYYTANNKRNYSGFPQVLKIYTSQTDQDLSLTAMFAGAPTSNWDKARFVFDSTVTCKRLVLEFTDVTTYSKVADGNPIAVAGELFLVQPVNTDLNEILDIFSDYSQYELKPEYNSIAKLNELREKAMDSTNYIHIYKAILDRADAILSGAIKKDPYREFSTEDGARNKIKQIGDMVDYSRNKNGGLKLPNFGTNQQLTGLGGTTGETITIYVEAEAETKLPQILFTQTYGAWNSWKATVNLKPGKNVFTFPNIKAHGGYSVDIAAGGPIHILNPYTPETQRGNVKLYIEGGYLYPVFRYGDDEETFKMILKDYYEKLMDENNTAITVDAFECVSDHVICSTRATQAYQQYIVKGVSPQANIATWDDWIKKLLAYGGVQFDSSQPFYDKRNDYVNVNIRADQPYAGMFAFAWTDHVGLPDGGMQTHLVNKGVAGWAMGHEVGHMLDIQERRVGETTNNMWAIFDIYMIDGNFNNRINVSNVAKNLASDFSDKVNNFYANGSDNCDIWWILEGGHPGYWGNSENMYRYEQTGKTLGVTEKFVYYGSLATGEDLSEYFERWGFYRGDAFKADNRFSYEKSSQEFKDLMAAAKASGRITGNGKKFWYVNNDQYRLEREHGISISADWASCYSESNKINITSNDIMKSDNGYTFILPSIKNSQAHLCYEIQSKVNGVWKVAGITYSTIFTDSYNYGDTIPEYRIYAYDRMFNHTGDPVSVIPNSDTQNAVCRVGDTYFDSLSKAVAAAESNAIIYLLKDFHDGSISINKPLTILVDESVSADSITITKNTDGNLFNVMGAGFTFKLGSNNSTKKIILDGGGFWQSGSLLKTSGSNYAVVRTEAYNVTFRNNYTTGNGGGLYVGYCGQIYLFKSIVQNNYATNGAGVYLEGSNPGFGRSQMALFNAIIENNVASNNGGGIYSSNINGTNFVLNSTSNNDPEYSKVIIRNNQAVNGGGIYADNIVELRFLSLINNHATNSGGGIYIVRKIITFVSSTIAQNTAGDNKSGAVYIQAAERFTLNGGSVEGGIYRPISGIFNLDGSLPDFSQAVFNVPPIPEEGFTIINNIANFVLTEEQVNALYIENGLARLEGTSIKAVRKLADVTLKFDGRTEVVQVPWGNFTLPEHLSILPDSKYIVNWHLGGTNYSVGDVYVINKPCTFELTTANYCVVNLDYGNDITDIIYIVPGQYYHLPMRAPNDDVIFGWEDNDGNYYPYADGVKITKSLTFTAVVKQQVKVTLLIGENKTENMFNIGDTLILPMPNPINGKVFKHWLIDGIKYSAGASLMVNSNINVVAEFTENWKVVTVIDETEKIEYYENKAIITLSRPQEAMGRVFSYWLIDGVKYFADSEYVVNKDVELIAVFAQINKEEKITVTFVWNKGADDSGEIVENETLQLEKNYLEEITLTKPEVNSGYVFCYWEINGNRYYAGEKIKVTDAFTATAVVKSSDEVEPEEEVFTVTVIKTVNGVQKSERYKYSKNESFVLKTPEASLEKPFLHWLVDGNKFNAGDTIIITSNTTITAVYYESPEEKPDETPDNENTDNETTDSEQNKNNNSTKIIIIVAVALTVIIGGSIIVWLIKKKRENR